MTTWAIGDVHACLDDLERLLAHIDFSADRDRLWFVGDLVNRGPQSLATLRFVRDLGERAVCVLGNHDLHLLATAAGSRRKRRKDRFGEVLNAPDRADLLAWLRARPLLHHDAGLGFTLVHAGIHPAWDLATASGLAREVERILRGPDHAALFEYMYGNEPARWSPRLSDSARHRVVINTFTRMRYCHADGTLDFSEKGPPGSQMPDLMPWFEVPQRANADLRIIFGHWSTLGYMHRRGVYSLDTGCYRGGTLSALCLDDPDTLVRVECRGCGN